MNNEENKTVISMDMGGAIEPVVLPTEEEEVKIEVPEAKSAEVPQLMQIGNGNSEVPPIMEGLVETDKPEEKKEETKIEEKPKPVPVPTIGPIPAPPKPEEPKVEAPKAQPAPAPAAPNLEDIKNEAKAEALAAAKPVPVPTIGPLPTAPVTPPEVKQEAKVETPVAPATAATVEVPATPAPAPTPEIPATPATPAPAPEVPTVTLPEVETKTEPVVETTAETEDLDKTMNIPAPVGEEVVEEPKEEGPEIIKGPNVIEAPIASENKEKEKKKNPYFLECPPNCIPIKPMGYIGYNILYAIPVFGLIFMLAHSASSKNYNRRNHARSKLIAIFLIILIIVGLIYLLDVDILSIIENATGYKIDIQHFKFTKFK